jgi:hypothetical protein
MDQERLEQLIDACRPGRNDLREPELAALADRLARDAETAAAFERSQRFDAAVAAAFRDAPVPSGLEERLLEAVGAKVVAATPAQIVAPVQGRRRQISRRWFWGSAAAVAAAVMVASLVGYFRTTTVVTPSELVAQTQDMLRDVDFRNPRAWKPVTGDDLARFPGRYIHGRSGPDLWRSIDTNLDRRAVVYRIPVRNKSAYLFAIKGSSVGLTGAPSTPLPGATGGWKMAAWTSGGLIYVLAFEDDLRALLRTPATA